ncbi:hypothetical protein ABBQ32_007061 [Trebouxia sp. C0010 RCD-2024]
MACMLCRKASHVVRHTKTLSTVLQPPFRRHPPDICVVLMPPKLQALGPVSKDDKSASSQHAWPFGC